MDGRMMSFQKNPCRDEVAEIFIKKARMENPEINGCDVFSGIFLDLM